MRKLFGAIVLMFMSWAVIAENTPDVTVKTVADEVLAEVLKNKVLVEKDGKFMAELVDRLMLPIVDQEYMAKRALGKHWKSISPAQRNDFIMGFKRLLIKTYSGAFKAYNGQKVTYGKTRFDKTGTKAIVSSEIEQPGSTPIDLQYTLHKTDGGKWLVYDARVAGLGLVKTYRSQFSEQIQRDGIDKTIAELKAIEL